MHHTAAIILFHSTWVMQPCTSARPNEPLFILWIANYLPGGGPPLRGGGTLQAPLGSLFFDADFWVPRPGVTPDPPWAVTRPDPPRPDLKRKPGLGVRAKPSAIQDPLRRRFLDNPQGAARAQSFPSPASTHPQPAVGLRAPDTSNRCLTDFPRILKYQFDASKPFYNVDWKQNLSGQVILGPTGDLKANERGITQGPRKSREDSKGIPPHRQGDCRKFMWAKQIFYHVYIYPFRFSRFCRDSARTVLMFQSGHSRKYLLILFLNMNLFFWSNCWKNGLCCLEKIWFQHPPAPHILAFLSRLLFEALANMKRYHKLID